MTRFDPALRDPIATARVGGETPSERALDPAALESDRGWGHVGRRALYWLPVFTSMVLFAQVAFLGLRPALCEQRRLADAEVELQARWQRDVRLRDEIVAGLRARQDPIFLERQRRLRQGPLQEARVEPAY